jgi:hypothetical protein
MLCEEDHGWLAPSRALSAAAHDEDNTTRVVVVKRRMFFFVRGMGVRGKLPE